MSSRCIPLMALVLSFTGPLLAHAASDPDVEQLKAHMNFLCSDQCAGRKTGSEGERIAGNYLVEHFKSLGLVPMKASAGKNPSPYHLPFNMYGASDRGTAYNIAGVLPGTDETLKQEYVFLVAHYDHLGKSGKGIYRGACDNASGTTSIMEIARYFKDNPTKRSLAFVAFSGEEMGMLGSNAYVSKPVIPLKQIKAVINLDLVGRNDESYLNIIIAKTDGIVSTLTRDGREMCAKYGITPSAGPERYAKGGGDSAPFVLKGIPSIWFDNGMYPEYHKTSDTVDKINFNKMVTTVKIARDLAEKVANDEKAPVFLPKSEWSQWKWAPNMEEDWSRRARGPQPE